MKIEIQNPEMTTDFGMTTDPSLDPLWFVIKYINELNWEGLSQNTSIPLEFFEKHALAGTRDIANLHSKECKLDWDWLSRNTSIPLEFFEKHLDKVNWNGLSCNASIPLEFFEEHLDEVNWEGLSYNTSIVDKPLNIKGARR